MKATILVLCAVLGCMAVVAQQPPAATPAPAAGPSTGTSSSKSGNNKERQIPSFLILGTVFDQQALALPGVRVRIRRTDETKYHWETYTNSRGEFAVRVAPGYQYEVNMHFKKYKDQSEMVDSNVDVQQRLSVKLQPVEPPNRGAKP
jgi:Carboxypeptidase regulatory-like domain